MPDVFPHLIFPVTFITSSLFFPFNITLFPHSYSTLSFSCISLLLFLILHFLQFLKIVRKSFFNIILLPSQHSSIPITWILQHWGNYLELAMRGEIYIYSDAEDSFPWCCKCKAWTLYQSSLKWSTMAQAQFASLCLLYHYTITILIPFTVSSGFAFPLFFLLVQPCYSIYTSYLNFYIILIHFPFMFLNHTFHLPFTIHIFSFPSVPWHAQKHPSEWPSHMLFSFI